MRRTARLGLATGGLLAALAVGASGQGSSPPVEDNPCLRPELHLRCPNLVMRRPSGLHLLHARDGRWLLASTNRIVNVGDGPLELRATIVREYRMVARQVLRAKPGGRDLVLPPAGRVDFYDTGGAGTYWKFRHAAAFELWRLTGDGTPVRPVRFGPKLHYCFRDLRRVRRLDRLGSYAGSPHHARFGACSQHPGQRTDVLGTSVGWADIYPWRYPDNWISVGGLRGCFAYVQRVDPLNLLRESREDDNAALSTIRLPWRGMGLHGCPHAKPAAIYAAPG